MHSLYKTACRLETGLTAEVVIGRLRLMLTPATSHAPMKYMRLSTLWMIPIRSIREIVRWCRDIRC